MTDDEKYINHCFELAKKGIGKVEPNPYVGAVIVKNGSIIGEGWHEYFGGNHAEVNAFANVAEDVAGATLYCNLEPCCHTNKKTPACVPLIIEKRISRVVISTIDRNPEVSGKGLEMMENAGIEVISGILQKEGAKLNKEFFSRFLSNQNDF